jgi:hypothetical protein
VKEKIEAVAVCVLIAIAAMTGCAKAETLYSLEYSAGDGGSIAGFAVQTVAEGSDGQGVIAVADTGYRFVRWSDGNTNAARTDGSITGNGVFEAEFERVTYELNYTVDGNGHLEVGGEDVGDSFVFVRNIFEPEGIPDIKAVPDEGNTFKAWSDGLREAERNDSFRRRACSFTASFSEIAGSDDSGDGAAAGKEAAEGGAL